MKHFSVLLKESVDALALKEDGIYVDGTLGRGGHSQAILKQIPRGHLYAFDRDQTAIDESQERLKSIGENVTLIHANFSTMRKELEKLGVTKVDGILLDLGVSSPQFDEAARGFSYRFDAPLDMRMDQSQLLTAYDIVNTCDASDLVSFLYRYGEEAFAKPIVKQIVKAREKQPIRTTLELVEIIRSALPAKILHKKGHPAKKTFQAIRIVVNDELSELHMAVADGLKLLNDKGRFSIISFHSLEDRIVKEAFQAASNPPKLDKRLPILPKDLPQADYRLITKKPITASESELSENNRSHSAKLRVIERIS